MEREKKREQEALFWCGLLQAAILGQVGKGKLASYLRTIAGEEATFPDGSRRRPSLSTLKRKLKRYRTGSFEGVARKRRADRGRLKAANPELLATALAAKREEPRRSAQMLNVLLQAKHGATLARSTLYRHLCAHGATRRKLGVSKAPVRKRWSAQHSHDLWVGDFMHGPWVLVHGKAAPTRLSAFLDAHSRVVVAARYYLNEAFDILIDTLLRGFAAYSLPRALYLDNAKVYWSDALRRACFRLEIDLWHRPVRDPAPGGVIERFFQTAQGQFEVEARLEKALTVERLNENFQAWLEEGYHRQVHSELGVTPLERLAAGAVARREVDLERARECFWQSEARKVDKTFSDVQLEGAFYRVDKRLRGDRLEVRYDPFGPRAMVKLYQRRTGAYLGEGVRHERAQGERPDPAPPKPSGPSPILAALRQRHQERLEQDWRPQVTRSGPWTLAACSACLADLWGRRGAVSAFDARELEALQTILTRHPALTRQRLERAVSRAARPTLPALAYALDQED